MLPLKIAQSTEKETPKAVQDLIIVAYGDSLTAGYGLEPDDTFPMQLQRDLQAHFGLEYNVIVHNAGVSGDTSMGGAHRLDWTLQTFETEGHKIDLFLLALGANDGLRGINPVFTRQSLESIIVKLQEKKIPVMLVGMFAPPNMDDEYAAVFNEIYPDLAKKYKTPLYPFFLKDVATKSELNQQDGIHPNAKGVAVMVENMKPDILKNLKK